MEKRARWAELVRAHAASGKSMVQFCRENNLEVCQLSYWRGVIGSREKLTAGGGFVEVKVRRETPGVWVICGRWRVQVDTSFDPDTLRRVAEALS